MTIRVGFENLPMPLVRHLQDSITTWPVQPHFYHVTEIIYCLRRAWYKRTHPERVELSVRSLWNIYRGNTFDRKWTSLFPVHQKNYKVKRDGITITGTCDFVYDDGDGDIIYDLKMPSSTFFKKRGGAGQGYRRQVQTYLSLAHANGELLDVHRARVLMVAEDVVVEEVEEWPGMLDSWVWPRALALDAALRVGSPVGLPTAEEGWECGVDPEGAPYCPVDPYFRKTCEMAKRQRKLEVPLKEPLEEEPVPRGNVNEL
uniref:PD-(D/E)XK nuclease superfamily protein n=1 Tax=viral metagenome TaxID=1070528 RepID=A0A6M3LZV7_9ZZZZ